MSLGDVFTLAESQITTASVTTQDATPTALYTFALPTNFVGFLSAFIVGRKSDGSQRAVFGRSMAVWCDASVPGNDTVRVVGVDYESDVAWDASISRIGSTVAVLVTGKAATTITWSARVLLVAG